ncbi:hypothetical protein [Rhizobium sp. BK176]|uniref:hypothetical protein n=1 Tax=Rhizobium sp. BK176 TaxID=2587071 RepID=UPI00216A334F|nr:hypothetical protein [Rhizobium sp. BK176]MCS4089321.1 hypothetical protein [Rhizobium sp. BK176]
MSSDEVPVAAMATINSGQPETELRFFGGRFYRRSSATTFEAGSCGLEGEMGRAICDHLIDERMSAAAIGPGDDGAGWKKQLWRMHKEARLSQERKSRNLSAVPDELWALTKPFDPVKHTDELLPKWADAAAAYVSSLIVVDGRLWLPVDEPMLAIKDGYALYDDASCCRAKNNIPSKLPSPFGTDKGPLGKTGDCHPYWDPRYSFVSFLEAVEDPSIPINGPCDVLMPEAFTVDHASLQLDRAARVAAASIDWLLKESDLLFFQSSLKRMLKPGSRSTLDAVDVVLGELSHHLIRRSGEPAIAHLLRKTQIQGLIERARFRWNDRPVELGNDLGSYKSCTSSNDYGRGP